jgi:hypothetical protein
VGSGSVVGRDLIMEHSKTDHPQQILSIGISTGWNSVGIWKISVVEGRCLFYV